MVERREKKVTRMVIIMIVAFNVAWAPYAFVAILKILGANFVSTAAAVPGLLFCKTYVYQMLNLCFYRSIEHNNISNLISKRYDM